MPGIDFYVDSGLAVITMADSTGGNLLNEESLDSLQQALTASLSHESVRAVLLRSNGDRFCLGMLPHTQIYCYGSIERQNRY